MKYLNIIAILLIASFFTSCNEEVELIDFSGVYVGPLSCVGAVHEDNGTEAKFIITKIDDQQYRLDLGDDVIFTVRQEENTLIIPKQTANEGNGFDEVTLDGDITKTETGIKAIFTVSVDDEGDSSCDIMLEKR